MNNLPNIPQSTIIIVFIVLCLVACTVIFGDNNIVRDESVDGLIVEQGKK